MPPWGACTQEDKDRFFCGNKDASYIMSALARWTHIYDDLIDGDSVDPANVHDMFWDLLIDLPANPLYRQLEHLIRPIYITGILNWRGANDIERAGDIEELHVSHATRYSIVDIGFILMVACGGRQHAEKHAKEMRLKFQCDTWDHYLNEHFAKGMRYG